MISQADYDKVRVGESEEAVRKKLPDGNSFMTDGLDRKGPERPAGTDCLALLSSDDSGLTTNTVFRFCFKDGKLVDKQAYESDQ